MSAACHSTKIAKYIPNTAEVSPLQIGVNVDLDDAILLPLAELLGMRRPNLR